MTLVEQWFKYFEEKIFQEFGQNVKEIEGYQPDVSPLVYCCLNHKRVPNTKRQVILSNEFKSSALSKELVWLGLKEVIENGDDINCYMSKSLKDWQSIDYLLYTCKIRHFHLYKNSEGGVRRDLVFGIFTEDKFYGLCAGDHNDIYETKKLIKIAEDNWPKELFHYYETLTSTSEIDNDTFKIFANHPNFQFNLFAPVTIKESNNSSVQLDNNQHTVVMDFDLNGINYKKVPFKAICAYNNEIEHIEKIENELCKKYKTQNLNLKIDKECSQYIVTDHNHPSLVERIPFLTDKVICSLYDGYH